MTTQVQVRGAAQATQEARTLADRELDVNTTDKRICIHNGSTAGGVPHANCFDIQNQEWTYAAASGTDSITITLAKAPAAYAAGQKFSFKAANTNTGSATLNVNSLGAKTIKKVAAGALAALVAGDIVSGAIYEVTYDGTDMILINSGSSSSGGDCVLLGSVTASASSTLDFTSLITSDYDYYEFIVKDLRTSAATNVLLRASTDNGSTWRSTAADYVWQTLKWSNATVTAAGDITNETSIKLCESQGTGATTVINGVIRLFNPLGTSAYKHIQGEFTANLAGGSYPVHWKSTGTVEYAADVDAIRLLLTTGTFTSGEVDVYGYKNA
jgi:hypothetical protein